LVSVGSAIIVKSANAVLFDCGTSDVGFDAGATGLGGGNVNDGVGIGGARGGVTETTGAAGLRGNRVSSSGMSSVATPFWSSLAFSDSVLASP
jgi:hypothetical protein